MHKLMEFTEEVCELKDKLTEWLGEEFDKGKENIDGDEAGKVTDMIKDLAEAEEKAWKAMYYELICCSMTDAAEHKESRYGYDRWRYASGRYAPTGHGHRTRAGYTPGPEHWPTTVGLWMGDETYPDYDTYRMGYPGETRRSQTGTDMRTSTMGGSYGKYQNARRHYTETGSRKDKEEMDEHAMHHLTETAETLRDIWRNADPDLKRKMKTDLSALMTEMQ